MSLTSSTGTVQEVRDLLRQFNIELSMFHDEESVEKLRRHLDIVLASLPRLYHSITYRKPFILHVPLMAPVIRLVPKTSGLFGPSVDISSLGDYVLLLYHPYTSLSKDRPLSVVASYAYLFPQTEKFIDLEAPPEIATLRVLLHPVNLPEEELKVLAEKLLSSPLREDFEDHVDTFIALRELAKAIEELGKDVHIQGRVTKLEGKNVVLYLPERYQPVADQMLKLFDKVFTVPTIVKTFRPSEGYMLLARPQDEETWLFAMLTLAPYIGQRRLSEVLTSTMIGVMPYRLHPDAYYIEEARKAIRNLDLSDVSYFEMLPSELGSILPKPYTELKSVTGIQDLEELIRHRPLDYAFLKNLKTLFRELGLTV